MPWMTRIRSSMVDRISTVGAAKSPFTGAEQVSGMDDDRWYGRFTYAAMTRAEAAPLLAAIAAQRGGRGEIVVYDPDFATRLTTDNSVGAVNGGAQAGMSLVTDSWTPSTTIAKAGEYAYVAMTGYYQVFRLTADAVTNGAGQVTLALDAPLRSSPADNAGVYINPPALAGIKARLKSHTIPEVGPDGYYIGIQIDWQEIVQ